MHGYRDRNGNRWFPYDTDGGTYLHPERAEKDMGDMEYDDAEGLVGPLQPIDDVD